METLPLQLITVIGLFLLCCNTGTFTFGPGEALALFDALCLAGLLVFGEQAISQMDVTSVTTLQVGVTMLISLVCAFIFDDLSVPGRVDFNAWMVVIYLAVICTIFATSFRTALWNIYPPPQSPCCSAHSLF